LHSGAAATSSAARSFGEGGLQEQMQVSVQIATLGRRRDLFYALNHRVREHRTLRWPPTVDGLFADPGTFCDGGHGYARTVPGGEQLGARSQDRVLSCVMAPAAGCGSLLTSQREASAHWRDR